jgi:predicted dehydrogenase
MARVALVGTGFIGEVHANAYSGIENGELAAVISTSKERGPAFAKKHGANYYPNLPEAVKKEKLDCVDICTPTNVHADMVVEAAELGLHVLCEKPLALTLADVDRMIEAVRRNGVKGMAGHTLRFWPEYVKAKEIVDSGELGQPLHAFCTRLAATPDWHKNGWGMNEKAGGGASVDLHIHDLDFLIWLLGKPKLVNAVGVNDARLGGVSHISTSISFAAGPTAVAEGGWAFSSSFPFTMAFRVLCEKGTVEWTFRAGKNIENRADKAKVFVYKNDGTTEVLDVPDADAYTVQCRYFVDCVDANREIENATLQDGRNALELALAATRSAKELRTVEL